MILYLIFSFTNIKNIYQVGITAWGIGCGQSGVPGAYASISSNLCFIDWAIKCKEQSVYQDYIDIKVSQTMIHGYEHFFSINKVLLSIFANFE